MPTRADLLPGTLDVLVLKAVSLGYDETRHLATMARQHLRQAA